jgi:ribosome-binding factor A
MSLHRIERVNELMQREVASALFRVLSPVEFDPAGVTVTHAITTHDLRSCKVLVSFYGDEAQKKRNLSALLRNRGEIQKEVARHVSLKWMPKIHFQVDDSLAKGDAVLQLLDRLPPPAPDQPAAGTV